MFEILMLKWRAFLERRRLSKELRNASEEIIPLQEDRELTFRDKYTIPKDASVDGDYSKSAGTRDMSDSVILSALREAEASRDESDSK